MKGATEPPFTKERGPWESSNSKFVFGTDTLIRRNYTDRNGRKFGNGHKNLESEHLSFQMEMKIPGNYEYF